MSLISKIKNINYLEEKIKIVAFGLLLLLLLYFSFYLFTFSLGKYNFETKLSGNIDQAIYMIDLDDFSLNIPFSKLVPSSSPYIYRFSVSNYKDSLLSDIDIQYSIKIKKTSNLPLKLEMYKNQLYDEVGSINILDDGNLIFDDNNTPYYVYETTSLNELFYENMNTDYYTLVVYYPIEYKDNIKYFNFIDDFELIIESEEIS